jgi:hypothetical protein
MLPHEAATRANHHIDTNPSLFSWRTGYGWYEVSVLIVCRHIPVVISTDRAPLRGLNAPEERLDLF